MKLLGPALLFAVRDIKLRKFVSALTVLAIASGVASFTALRIVSTGTQLAARSVVSRVISGELLVYGEGLCDVSEFAVEELESLPAVSRAVPVVLAMGYMEGSLVFLLGVRPEDLDLAVARYIEGGGFGEDDYRVVIVEASFAEERGLSVGDIVIIKPQLGSTAYPYRIVGVADIGMRVQELSAVGTYAIVPLREAQAMLDREGYVTMVMLKLEDENLADYVREEVLSVYPRARVFSRREVMRAVFQVIALVDGLMLSVTLIGLTIAVFGTSSTIMSNVREHAREIAVMRALGAPVHHVAKVFLLEAAILGLLGGMLGLVLGIVGADFARKLVSSAGLFKVPLIIDPTVLALAFVLAVVSSQLSALYPVLKACRIKPMEVLRNE